MKASIELLNAINAKIESLESEHKAAYSGSFRKIYKAHFVNGVFDEASFDAAIKASDEKESSDYDIMSEKVRCLRVARDECKKQLDIEFAISLLG